MGIYPDEVGYNFRMPNINAALGLAQLEKINTFVSAKRKLFLKYNSKLSKINGVHFSKKKGL